MYQKEGKHMGYDLVKEKGEAIAAGEEALEYLMDAKQSLDSAKNWGIFDILGGGFIVSAVKHSKMGEAKRNISMAQAAIKRFNKELRDVRDIDNSLGVGLLGTIFDFCDDDFLADLYVQSKINKSRDQVNKAIDTIEDILEQLRY